MNRVQTADVCIVGGGPAGMMLALLLAHKGIQVLVLEKNKDFSREYRGEVLMPRFTQMMQNLGLEQWLLDLPHLKLEFGEIIYKDKLMGKLDFSKAAPQAPYALWIPQPVLLNGLYEKAKTFPSFNILFGAHVESLLTENGKVTGVKFKKEHEDIEINARVTIGADGRYSTIVKHAGFEKEYEDYKFDILWFTIPKPENYKNTFKVLLSTKRSVLLLPKFPDEIQAGILVGPHELNEIKNQGIESIKKELCEKSPLFESFAKETKDFTVFHPLQAELFFMKEWAKEGCLLIGDAAHCCSPAGAIGVSVAIGTAIVTAGVLVDALKETKGVLSKSVLDKVQMLREKEVREIHNIQRRLTGGLLGSFLPVRFVLPALILLLSRTPFFLKVQRRLMVLPKDFPFPKEIAWKSTKS